MTKHFTEFIRNSREIYVISWIRLYKSFAGSHLAYFLWILTKYQKWFDVQGGIENFFGWWTFVGELSALILFNFTFYSLGSNLWLLTSGKILYISNINSTACWYIWYEYFLNYFFSGFWREVCIFIIFGWQHV
jgi:hypothetical protein